MCTLLLLSGQWPDAPLILAANRDEKLDRPAAAPELRTDGPIDVLAPRDVLKGGTWLGINRAGVVVGITNRFPPLPVDPNHKSRGQLPLLALEHPTARAASESLQSLSATDYPPFHLLMADRSDTLIVWSNGQQLQATELAAGAHILTERSFEGGSPEREDLLRSSITPCLGPTPPTDDTLHEILAQHADEGFNSPCVHIPDIDYGTRSSTLIRLGVEPTDMSFQYADGPACKNTFEPFGHLLNP